jgi:hypothetical protein
LSGSTGTPAARISAFDPIFDPIASDRRRRRTDEDQPADGDACAKSARSERKP